MKLPLLAMLLFTLMCGISQAEVWTQISGKEDDGSTLFIDLTSRTRKGNYVAAKMLREHQVPVRWSGNDSYSTKSQYEFDCSSPQVKSGPFYAYEEHGGKGIIVHGYDQWNEMWFSLQGRKMLLAARDMACALVR